MALEFILNPSTTDILIIVIIFLLFVMVAKKIINILTNLVIISVAAVLAPIFANRFLGTTIATDVASLFTYIVAGALVYFLYLSSQKIAAGLKSAASAGGKILPKRREEKVKIVEKVVERPSYKTPIYGTGERSPQAAPRVKNTPSYLQKRGAKMMGDYVVIEDPDGEKEERTAKAPAVKDVRDDEFIEKVESDPGIKKLPEIKPGKKKKPQ